MDMASINMASTLMPLAPIAIVAITAIVVMLLIAIKRNHTLIATTTIIGLNAAVACIIWQVFFLQTGPQAVMGLFVVDGFALFN
ncbi:MAG: hypothetical protein EOO68_04225, partial [Moraxellaceae bacterium]